MSINRTVKILSIAYMKLAVPSRMVQVSLIFNCWFVYYFKFSNLKFTLQFFVKMEINFRDDKVRSYFSYFTQLLIMCL